jgi:hypothetical protein
MELLLPLHEARIKRITNTARKENIFFESEFVLMALGFICIV